MKRVLFIALFISGSVIAACKSGEGERCQVDDDCTTGLSCNKAKNVCQGQNNMPVDALYPEGLPIDAPHD